MYWTKPTSILIREEYLYRLKKRIANKTEEGWEQVGEIKRIFDGRHGNYAAALRWAGGDRRK